mgnify:CR=1 FL=1
MSILDTAYDAISDLLPDGWTLKEAIRRGKHTVELQCHPPNKEGLGVGIEWTDAEGPAFARGPRYGASYRRGPGLVDLNEEGAPDALRALAHALCKRLAELEKGPSLTLDLGGFEGAKGDPVEHALKSLPKHLKAALGSEALPNREGWRLVEVKEMQRWTRVAEVQLACESRHLTMILSPSDEERPAFRRGRHLDLIYYSDDLAVSEHEALYARDRVMIDAFAIWFMVWDS